MVLFILILLLYLTSPINVTNAGVGGENQHNQHFTCEDTSTLTNDIVHMLANHSMASQGH